MNNGLRKQKPPIFCSRGVQRKTMRIKGVGTVKERALQNLEDMKKVLEWNYQHGIAVYRMSSEIFSHITDPECQYSLDFAMEKMAEVGEVARHFKQRLTFHPGQFNVVGTPTEASFEHTVRELTMHADVFEAMGCDEQSIMVIHGGGTYGDKEATKQRWVDNFGRLPERVQKRLVLENCEKSYSVLDCIHISEMVEEKYGFPLPIVIDTHHDDCYKLLAKQKSEKTGEPIKESLPHLRQVIPTVLQGWKKRGIRPKFHISEQGEGRIGKHSDFIKKVPKCLFEVWKKYGVAFDLMVEAKAKEAAIQQLYQKYPELVCFDMTVKGIPEVPTTSLSDTDSCGNDKSGTSGAGTSGAGATGDAGSNASADACIFSPTTIISQ